MSISVLLADDQPLLRRGFRMILEAEPDLIVVAEAGDGEEAADLARHHGPDVVLMDIRMPGTDGKLGLRDRVQVVVLAYETGLVRPGTRPAPGPGR